VHRNHKNEGTRIEHTKKEKQEVKNVCQYGAPGGRKKMYTGRSVPGEGYFVARKLNVEFDSDNEMSLSLTS
jgi:hypothetical protein